MYLVGLHIYYLFIAFEIIFAHWLESFLSLFVNVQPLSATDRFLKFVLLVAIVCLGPDVLRGGLARTSLEHWGTGE